MTKLKTRCYYTDYVNHMIRFYLSTPDGINLRAREYSAASIANWTAVQMVFHKMDPGDAAMIKAVFGCNYYLPKAVETYCEKTGTDIDTVWRVLTKVSAKIARVRGLM